MESREIIEKEHPDMILVHGDTTTCFASTLAGFYSHIPVGHVEAGLRTGNLMAPSPEEANRIMTTRLAQLHLAPTGEAHQNLLRENVAPENIIVTGNSVIDALLWVRKKFPISMNGGMFSVLQKKSFRTNHLLYLLPGIAEKTSARAS